MHVSDIHCSYDNVSKLKQWLQDTKQLIDVVLVSGDIANVPLTEYHTASQELVKKHEEHLKTITESFLSISPKVYYIPGNVSGHFNWAVGGGGGGGSKGLRGKLWNLFCFSARYSVKFL